MATTTLTPELLRLSSTIVSPLAYFTDSSNSTNTKSDLILVVENKKFYCHRLLLSLISPVFTRMFEGQFKEHSEQEIVLEGKSSESILELLKYTYPQFHGEVNDENVEDFLRLADEYMIEHLKQPCKNLLLKQLDQYKYVSIPTQQKLEKPSSKSKKPHASDAAHSASHPSDDQSSNHSASSIRPTTRRRVEVSPRLTTTSKPSSTHPKTSDKLSSSANTHTRYFLILDKTRFPTFFDNERKNVLFGLDELTKWIRRLRILYQIDKGRNYGEVIDTILGLLQFIPSLILLPTIQISSETFSNDEVMINDIARARLFMLEEWSGDDDSYQPVKLTDTYRTMSPMGLLTKEQMAFTSRNDAYDQEIVFQDSTTIATSDSEESTLPTDIETVE